MGKFTDLQRAYANRLYPSQFLAWIDAVSGEFDDVAVIENKLMLLGDSITRGGGAPRYVSAYRNSLYLRLRQSRNDVEFIGSAAPDFLQGADSLGLWRHQGTAGLTIENVTANYAAYVASAGQPDILRILVGVNNIVAGDSLATIQGKWLVMMATIRSVSPAVKILISLVLPLQNGSSTVGFLAAYEAVRIPFNAWLLSTLANHNLVKKLNSIPTPSGAIFTGPEGVEFNYAPKAVAIIDYNAQLGVADIQSDGVHPNLSGSGRMAEAEADALEIMLPRPSGLVLPRSFSQRPVPTTIANLNTVQFTVAGTDNVAFAAVSNLNLATDSFAVAINYKPTTLAGTAQAGAFQSIIAYGRQANQPNFWVLAQRGPAIEVLFSGGVATTADAALYVNGRLSGYSRNVVLGPNNTAIISDLPVNGINPPNANCLVLNQWHRLLLIIKRTGPAWNFNQQIFAIGSSADYNAALGNYDGLRFWKGSANIPSPGSRLALVAAEADYYENASAFPGMSAQYEMQEGTGAVVNSQVFGDGTGALGGAAAWVSDRHPWDYPSIAWP